MLDAHTFTRTAAARRTRRAPSRGAKTGQRPPHVAAQGFRRPGVHPVGEPTALRLTSSDGAIRLLARRWRSQLYVERCQQLPGGSTVTVYVMFDSASAFESWCGGDPARFGEPLMLAQLRRFGHEVFGERG